MTPALFCGLPRFHRFPLRPNVWCLTLRSVAEFTAQMLAYYAKNITARVVVPRRIQDNDYFLVCLQDKKEEVRPPTTDLFVCCGNIRSACASCWLFG